MSVVRSLILEYGRIVLKNEGSVDHLDVAEVDEIGYGNEVVVSLELLSGEVGGPLGEVVGGCLYGKSRAVAGFLGGSGGLLSLGSGGLVFLSGLGGLVYFFFNGEVKRIACLVEYVDLELGTLLGRVVKIFEVYGKGNVNSKILSFVVVVVDNSDDVVAAPGAFGPLAGLGEFAAEVGLPACAALFLVLSTVDGKLELEAALYEILKGSGVHALLAFNGDHLVCAGIPANAVEPVGAVFDSCAYNIYAFDLKSFGELYAVAGNRKGSGSGIKGERNITSLNYFEFVVLLGISNFPSTIGDFALNGGFGCSYVLIHLGVCAVSYCFHLVVLICFKPVRAKE